MSKIPFLLITGICATLGTSLSASAEEVFRSISDDGTVEFSDRSSKSSSSFQISNSVVVTSPPNSIDLSNFYEDPEAVAVAEAPSTTGYTDLQILTPANNEGGWIDGDVQVKVALDPQLETEHELVIQLDGTELTAGKQLNYALPDVHRGSHTLQVSVRNKTDGAILNTDTVNFQVHRRSARNTNTQMLHPSLRTEPPVDPSNIDEILAE